MLFVRFTARFFVLISLLVQHFTPHRFHVISVVDVGLSVLVISEVHRSAVGAVVLANGEIRRIESFVITHFVAGHVLAIWLLFIAQGSGLVRACRKDALLSAGHRALNRAVLVFVAVFVIPFAFALECRAGIAIYFVFAV